MQMHHTVAALRLLGVTVDTTSAFDVDLRNYDLVHGVQLGAEFVRKCRVARIPVVHSTIYVNRRQAMRRQPLHGRVRHGVALARAALAGSHLEKASLYIDYWQRLALAFESSDLLLPNSPPEARHVASELAVTTPHMVVVNAVEPSIFSGSLHSDWEGRAGVVCAGRLEPRKNQLALLRAMSGSRISLTLAGDAHPHHAAYAAACAEEARATGALILPQQTPLALSRIYGAARVHALPSWSETTGLVNLEAAAAGCNIVAGQDERVEWYLGRDAWWCDPGSRASIRDAVELAHVSPPRSQLGERVLSDYTWEETARQTLAAYQAVLM